MQNQIFWLPFPAQVSKISIYISEFFGRIGERAQVVTYLKVRLFILRTFGNMKKAVRSWGKYVPWPVVQLLLRAGDEAKLEVKEREATTNDMPKLKEKEFKFNIVQLIIET